MRHYLFCISVALITAGCASKPTLHHLAEEAVKEQHMVKEAAVDYYKNEWIHRREGLSKLASIPIFHWNTCGTGSYESVIKKGMPFDVDHVESIEKRKTTISVDLNSFVLDDVTVLKVQTQNHFDIAYVVTAESTVTVSNRTVERSIASPLIIPEDYRQLTDDERKACQGKILNNISCIGGSVYTSTYSECDTGGLVPFDFLPAVDDEIPDKCKPLLDAMIKECREKKEESVKEEWTVKLRYSVPEHGWSSESHQQLRRQRPKPMPSNHEEKW